MKDFKDTRVGKLLWKAGDALKGKGKAGAVFDVVGEIIPLPNPVRIAKSLARNEKVDKLRSNEKAIEAARELDIDLSDILDDSPSWVRSAFVFAVFVVLAVLAYTGAIDISWLIYFASEVLGAIAVVGIGFTYYNSLQSKFDKHE